MLCSRAEQGFASQCFPLLPRAPWSIQRQGQSEAECSCLHPSWNYPVVRRGGRNQCLTRVFFTKFPPRLARGTSRPIRDGNVQSRRWLCCCTGPSPQELKENLGFTRLKIPSDANPSRHEASPSPPGIVPSPREPWLREFHELCFESCLSTSRLS